MRHCKMCGGNHKFENCKLVKKALKSNLGIVACNGSERIFGMKTSCMRTKKR